MRNAPRCVVCKFKFKKGEDLATNAETGERAHSRCVGRVGGMLVASPKTFTLDQVVEILTWAETEIVRRALNGDYFDGMEDLGDLIREKLGVDEEGEPEERSIAEPPAGKTRRVFTVEGTKDTIEITDSPMGLENIVTNLPVAGPTMIAIPRDTTFAVDESNIREVVCQADLDAIEAETLRTGKPVRFSIRAKEGDPGFSFPYLSARVAVGVDLAYPDEPEIDTVVHLVDVNGDGEHDA